MDSLPVNADTIINSILIKTLTTASGIVTMKDQNDQDSIVNINDSIDLTKYVNATEKNNFLVLKVWAPNMEVQNEYKVNIRMHTMVPDSLSWGKDPIANNPVSNTAEKQKVVTLGDKILLFAQNNEIYSTAIPAGSPTAVSYTQLDVYKRQVMSKFSGFYIKTDFLIRITERHTFTNQSIHFLDTENKQIFIIIKDMFIHLNLIHDISRHLQAVLQFLKSGKENLFNNL